MNETREATTSELNKLCAALTLLADAIKYHADVIGYGADKENKGGPTAELKVGQTEQAPPALGGATPADTQSTPPAETTQQPNQAEKVHIHTPTRESNPELFKADPPPADTTGRTLPVNAEELRATLNSYAVSKGGASVIAVFQKYSSDNQVESVAIAQYQNLLAELDALVDLPF